ncbi:MAG: hypothetical protein EA412_00715 [Chitinophagaceae bacterium]|nr:MAG: hypothetical protein EA412_00715 [Chitinophagaceae bacterium]
MSCEKSQNESELKLTDDVIENIQIHLNDSSIIQAEVIENTLWFKTLKDYELAIEYLSTIETSENGLPYWEDEFSFKSMRLTLDESEINANGFDDEIFSSLVSPDGIIVIDNFIFKVDMMNENVKVQSFDPVRKNIHFKTDEDVKEFSVGENVLDLVFGIMDNEVDDFATRCSSQNTGWQSLQSTDGKIEYRVRYYKAGIYFTLRARIKKESGSGGYVDMYMNTRNYWTFFKNSKGCWTYSGSVGGSSSHYSMRPYSRMRSLSAFRYYVEFTIYDSGGGSPTTYERNLNIVCKFEDNCFK